MNTAPRLIETKKPICRISTGFPFKDLKSSKMNISCHSTLTLENVTIKETAIYTCRARIAFKPIISSQTYKNGRHRRKIQPIVRKNGAAKDPYSINYEMSAKLLVRVSRSNDYYVHKIVALVIGGVVIITLLFLVGKKVLGHKLGWESKETCNYAQEWPNAVPARTIASAGSLHHSRSTLRRPSEPCIAEAEEEAEYAEAEFQRRNERVDSFNSEDTNEAEIEHENDPEEDKAEIKEFLRKVRSHGSFKIIIGDESPRSVS